MCDEGKNVGTRALMGACYLACVFARTRFFWIMTSFFWKGCLMKAKLLAVAIMSACLLASGCSQSKSESKAVANDAETKEDRAFKIIEQLQDAVYTIIDLGTDVDSYGAESYDKLKTSDRKAFGSDQQCTPGMKYPASSLTKGSKYLKEVGEEKFRGPEITDYCNGDFEIEAVIDDVAYPEIAGIRLMEQIKDVGHGGDECVFDVRGAKKWDQDLWDEYLSKYFRSCKVIGQGQ